METRLRQSVVIYTSASIAAFSAVAYELLLASYATFLMGATIFQYSLVISLMMMSMGVGALLTKNHEAKAAQWFLGVEISLAWIAAIAVPVLYMAFAKQAATRLILLLFVIFIGLAIGMEIPLLNFVQKSKKGVSRILFFDYLGGFAGGVLFPIFLLPSFGFFRVSAILSLLNALIALFFFLQFQKKFAKNRTVLLLLIGFSILLSIGYVFEAETLRHSMESNLFGIH